MTTTAQPDPAGAVRAWLQSPLTRGLVPRNIRAGIAALLAGSAIPASTTEHLTVRPELGTAVCLLADNWFLRERHGAPRGAVGRVVAFSTLGPGDEGVLVDWGDGMPVRCDLKELAPSG